MQGRIEHELEINKKIQESLENTPKFLVEWASNLEASDKTGATRRVFVRIVKKYLSSINTDLKSITLEDLTVQSVETYYSSIKRKVIIRDGKEDIKSTSDSYQQQIWCCLNNFFCYLVKRHYIQENPMETIGKPTNHDLEEINQRRILLTQKDFNKIIHCVKTGVGGSKAQSRQEKFRNRDLAIISLFMTTGMRKTALSEINESDINFETGELKVIDKGNKHQLYPLNNSVLNVIKDWINDKTLMELNNSDALFVTYQGNRMSGTSIDDLVAKYCQAALGKHISPHKLRAGFVSIYYKKTGDIEATRRAVGHSNIATTQRYIVTENTERKDAANSIASLLNI